MSTVTVQLFASYAEDFGDTKLEVPITIDSTAGDLVSAICALPAGGLLGPSPHWLVHEGRDGVDGILAWRATRDFDLDGAMGAIEPRSEARRRALHRLAAGTAALTVAGCGRSDDPHGALDFWAMGREAEVVAELLPAFRERHPEIRVRVQQLPWTAAHEKLLTAYAGDALPDLCQLGNTWLP